MKPIKSETPERLKKCEQQMKNDSNINKKLDAMQL